MGIDKDKEISGKGPNRNEERGGERGLDFIRQIVAEDVQSGKWGGRVATRFPPEPNGYLHIGHAKSICLNYGIAAEFGGQFNLRFDDTNPEKEEQEYVDSIIEDVRWLGADWDDRLFYASDYFEQMYEWAVELIQKGKAYVCDLTGDQVREYRGTLTQPGRESPYRNRSVEENLDLFERMRKGEFPDGSRDAAGQDRHGPSQSEHARPDHVPHPARDAPPPGRQVVHLPDVRLGPRVRGFHRGHHALDLHAGVRESPAAVRLVHRRGQRGPDRRRLGPVGQEDSPPAADRVRPAEPDLHRDEQAQAAQAGEGEASCAAGTIRGCRRSPACAGGAIRPRRSGASPSASASTSSTARSISPCWSTACART